MQNPKWPARFTDAWFRTHVPSLASEDLAALKAELHRRSWSDDEIARRVSTLASRDVDPGQDEDAHAHAHGSVSATAGSQSSVIATFKSSDAVARAACHAGLDLSVANLAGEKIAERTLADALGRHLEDAVVERRLPVPGWEPQPGNVDVFTTDSNGRPRTVIETKLKSGNQLFECLWDFAKVLSLAMERSVEGAYLVVGAPESSWQKPVAAAELFETGRHDLVAAIERYREWWIAYILGDSTGRPLEVPRLTNVELVARVKFVLRGRPWELRAIRVQPAGDDRVPFVEGLPA